MANIGKTMKHRKSIALMTLVAGLASSPWLWPQAAERVITQVSAGTKIKTEGVIVERTADQFTLREHQGTEIVVALTDQTRIREKKSNPFRSAKRFGAPDLMLGLHVRVRGVGDLSGHVLATEIRFKRSDLQVAETITSRVSPVEKRLDQAESRLEANEARSQLLSGEIEELDAAFDVARKEAGQARAEAGQAQAAAQAAQKTADEALTGVGDANRRISRLDSYEQVKTSIILFGFDSTELSADSKAQLDDVAAEAKLHQSFLLEVQGFASADGDAAHNLRLSQRRAEAVVRYLVENHQIPIRRIITPLGRGESNPAAENSIRQGRRMNRRAEIRLLVNRGLSEPSGNQ